MQNTERLIEFYDLEGGDFGEEDVSLDENGEERVILYGGQLDLVIEARDREDGKRASLIDIDAFREMQNLHSFILNITIEPPEKYAQSRIE